MQEAEYKIDMLSCDHDKKPFISEVKALDRFLKEQARQEMKRKVSVTYVLTLTAENEILGYYSLSSYSVKLNDLPEVIAKKLLRYPIVPTTLLGRLAVSKKSQGCGLGEILLIDALKKSFEISLHIGSFAVVVQAKDGSATCFYKKYGFTPFDHSANKLYLPMGTIQTLFT